MRSSNVLVLAPVVLAFASCKDHQVGPPSGVLTSVAFETRSEIAAGNQGAVDVAVADFDRDGRLDLAIACLADTVQVALGAGDGTFRQPLAIAVPGKPAAVAAADLDGDLDPDLLVLRADAGFVRVLRNDGAARFTEQEDLEVGPATFALAAGDCNHDGVVDLAVTQFGGNRLIVYHGTGEADFGPPATLALPAGAGGAGVAIGDVDRDAINDILVADHLAGRVLLIPGLASGGHGEARALPAHGPNVAVAIGDVNHDGWPDLLAACLAPQMLTIHLGQPDAAGVTWRQTGLAVDGVPGPLFVAELTGDGRNDVLTCVLGRCGVSVFAGLADGSLGEEVQLAAAGFPVHAVPADFDGDGRFDVVAAGGGERLSLWRSGPQGLVACVNYATGIDAPEFVAAGDFDGDGQNEVAVGGRASAVVSVLRQEPAAVPGRNAVRPVTQVDVGSPVHDLIATDLDRDARTDLVISCEGGIKLLVNTGAGWNLLPSAAPGRFVLDAAAPFEVAVGDLDADGRADLVAADARGALQVAHALDDHFHFASPPLRIPLGGTPAGIVLGDFVVDGQPDIAVSRNSDNVVTIVRNAGEGAFALHAHVPVGVGPNYLRTADFDGNGSADLVVSNAGADVITVLFSRGSWFEALPIPAGERPTALLARDLNRDGRPDILVASLVSADFRVLLGDGRGGFPVVLPFAGTYRATSAALADLDGDRLADLLLASVDTNRVSLYRNRSH
jgi:hypothetical protein